MSQRTRSGKVSSTRTISPSKSKKKSLTIRTKKTSIKKTSPTKRHVESTSTSLIQPRQKRLSSLTAAALVHYCTSVLSPSRRVTNSKKPSPKNVTSSNRKRKISNVSSKSDTKHVQTDQHIRTRREASSRASAMIMQQNEIERSRCNYTLVTKQQSTTIIRRQRTKSELNKTDIPTNQQQQHQSAVESFQFNIPSIPTRPIPVPSIANISNQSDHTHSSHPVVSKSTDQESVSNMKYPSLTEAILAEHDRRNEALPSYHTIKHDNLIKWTQELASYGRLSPHESIDESTDSQSPKAHENGNTKEISISSITDSNLSTGSTANHVVPPPSFLFPSAGYPLDLRSFYPLLPCWQYPGKQSNQ